ncbi:MAG TPA: hypothetical protein VFJ90_05540 [Candidatus Didemnitutus sp.]|nr:hypothetical protein [Candidatus Didemnitutus sp.]
MSCPPVLFLIFNRPELTARVFARIREAKPARLFVAADGPRRSRREEIVLCEKTRRIVDDAVDWDCQVERLYRTENLGCKVAVSEAINFFFTRVSEGIILEDDCLPDPTFFRYCSELLERYRQNSRVFQISGFNPAAREAPAQSSYIPWHFGSIWGWATWRRAWAYYDRDMKEWPGFLQSGRLAELCTSEVETAERTRSFGETHAGRVDTWDNQWAVTRLINQAITLTPMVNLVTNLGFGENSTHTHDASDRRAGHTANALPFPLQHPASLEPNRAFGAAYWEGISGGSAAKPANPLRRAVNKMRRLWRTAKT